ncbi:hypothetical protein SEPCBS119000_001270 [Sporothrix epigloea]|uniref:Myb-like domain-containing protein n=1 Tax=Sporothrix epigloea TaxID=1892477 RepID=A0ABP0DDK5_9PEZI
MREKNWNTRADKDLFFTILSVKNIGIISGIEWANIGHHMRVLGYDFSNEGCRQHFQGLRRSQKKVELLADAKGISPGSSATVGADAAEEAHPARLANPVRRRSRKQPLAAAQAGVGVSEEGHYSPGKADFATSAGTASKGQGGADAKSPPASVAAPDETGSDNLNTGQNTTPNVKHVDGATSASAVDSVCTSPVAPPADPTAAPADAPLWRTGRHQQHHCHRPQEQSRQQHGYGYDTTEQIVAIRSDAGHDVAKRTASGCNGPKSQDVHDMTPSFGTHRDTIVDRYNEVDRANRDDTDSPHAKRPRLGILIRDRDQAFGRVDHL